MSPPDVDSFRESARRWLAGNAREYSLHGAPIERRQAVGDGGSHAGQIAMARQFQARLFGDGLAGITVPTEYGGRGLTEQHQLAFDAEAAAYRLPSAQLGVSTNIIGGTILKFGNDRQCARHLPRILSGDEIFVQMLTEPSGGSDLAALLTRADVDSGGFRLNGQKTWSTGAAEADYALCPARTDWTVSKHRGITMFIVDLTSPGLDIRPIRQIDGEAEFCEEFLSDVLVPSTAVLGEVNGGWQVVRGLLEIEHKWSGRHNTGRRETGDVRMYVELAGKGGTLDDIAVQREIAALHTKIRGHAALTWRIADEIAAGRMDPALGGLLKLSSDELTQQRAELALRIAAPTGLAWRSEADGRYARDYLNSRSASIAGGSDEIQRNNIGERALGLPREPSADAGVPFDHVTHN